MIMDREFKGIWIPAEIWLDRKLSPIKKVLLAEINSKNFNANTEMVHMYLAEFTGVSTAKVRKLLREMTKDPVIQHYMGDKSDEK